MSITPKPTDPVSTAFIELELILEHLPGIAVTLTHSKNGPVSYVTLERLVVNKEGRNKGTGTKIMQHICQFADTHQVVLACSPSADFGGNVKRLTAFYKRFGFVSNRKRSGRDYFVKELLIRNPEKPEPQPE